VVCWQTEGECWGMGRVGIRKTWWPVGTRKEGRGQCGPGGAEGGKEMEGQWSTKWGNGNCPGERWWDPGGEGVKGKKAG